MEDEVSSFEPTQASVAKAETMNGVCARGVCFLPKLPSRHCVQLGQLNLVSGAAEAGLPCGQSSRQQVDLLALSPELLESWGLGRRGCLGAFQAGRPQRVQGWRQLWRPRPLPTVTPCRLPAASLRAAKPGFRESG